MSEDKTKYSPFWILNPLKNNINIRNLKNWSFYTSKETIDGLSPLKDLGKQFFRIAHNHVSLYDHCLWVFNNSEFTSKNSNKLSRVLKSVSETFCNSYLSQTGVIVTHENGNITMQPTTPKHYESLRGENMSNEKLIRIINITESIYQNNFTEYLAIFEYLSEIRKSKAFIGQLALWSFLEHHWTNKKEFSKLDGSLSTLLNFVYDKRELKLERQKIRKSIEDIGKALGKEYNENHLRNILAHGKHYTLKEKWTDLEWQNFFSIHETLFELIIKGLEKEIITKNVL